MDNLEILAYKSTESLLMSHSFLSAVPKENWKQPLMGEIPSTTSKASYREADIPTRNCSFIPVSKDFPALQIQENQLD